MFQPNGNGNQTAPNRLHFAQRSQPPASIWQYNSGLSEAAARALYESFSPAMRPAAGSTLPPRMSDSPGEILGNDIHRSVMQPPHEPVQRLATVKMPEVPVQGEIAFTAMQSKGTQQEDGKREEMQRLMPPPPLVHLSTASPSDSPKKTKTSKLNTSSLPFSFPSATSQLHHFVKHLTAYCNRNKKKRSTTLKLPVAKSLAGKKPKHPAPDLDRLARIMKATICTCIGIFVVLFFVVFTRISAFNDAKDAKKLLLQQQVVSQPEHLDITKFIKQIKQEQQQRRDADKRLLTAGTVPLVDKFRHGIESQVIPIEPSPQPQAGRREVEWEEEKPAERPQIYYAPARPGPKLPRPTAEIVPKVVRPLGDSCQGCVKKSYLAHYYKRGCDPVVSRECDCPKFFRCPVKRTSNKSAIDSVKQIAPKPCSLESNTYDYNELIPLATEPCRICRCRKRNYYNGTQTKTVGEIDCSPYVECPEMAFGVKPKKSTCHFAYKHDQCCGTEICIDELPVGDIRARTTCRYRSKTFKYGEVIYPEEDTCLKCLCDEHWNEHDPIGSPSCQRRQCTSFLKGAILENCTPIYRSDGCCPIDYICPDKRQLYDAEENQEESSAAHLEQACRLNGKWYSLNEAVYIHRGQTHHGRTCARCKCQVPPMLTCQADFRCTE